MFLPLLLITLSLGILFAGAEFLVRGSSKIATRFGISRLVVGLTIVAFGTSSPELFVSIQAVLTGGGDIALGNVLGSNAFNIAVILGLTALICPITVHLQIIKFDAPVALFAAIALALLVMDGVLSRVEGGTLFAVLVIYIFANIRMARREDPSAVAESMGEPEHVRSGSWILELVMIIGGLAVLVFGSNLLVENAILVSRKLGISDAVIGLTVIAAGTSLPELVTSILAALRRRSDIAIGNVIGSNIFNILGILGVSSLIAPIRPSDIGLVDFAAVILFSLFVLPMIYTGRKLIRIEGAALLGLYAVYLWVLWPK